MKIKNILMAAALIVAPSIVGAQGVEVLIPGTDDRNVAMGGNFFGESRSSLVYSNPTSIYNGEKNWNVSFSYRSFDDSPGDAGNMTLGSFAASKSFGIHAVHLGYRKLDGLNIAGVKPASSSVDLGYSVLLGDFSVAAGMSYIKDELVDDATGVAFNASAYYRGCLDMAQGARYTVGLGAGNIGGDLDRGKKYAKVELPLYFGAGGEFGVDFNENHSVAVSLGMKYYSMKGDNSMLTAGLGAEYSLMKMVSVRAGYLYGENDNSAMTAGVGISLGAFDFSGAYVMPSSDDMVDSYMLSASVKF